MQPHQFIAEELAAGAGAGAGGSGGDARWTVRLKLAVAGEPDGRW